jgi:hypothetical protein
VSRSAHDANYADHTHHTHHTNDTNHADYAHDTDDTDDAHPRGDRRVLESSRRASDGATAVGGDGHSLPLLR